MADIDRYLVWESARSALKRDRSGAPRFTTDPRSACTLVTMPGAMGVTLTSRYALAVTLPGTVTVDPPLMALTGAVLIPARVSASGVRTISASATGSAGAGASAGAVVT